MSTRRPLCAKSSRSGIPMAASSLGSFSRITSLPLGSPVQFWTVVRTLNPTTIGGRPYLEKGALLTVGVWLETNRVSREDSNLRQSCPLMSRRRRTTDGMPRKRCGANPYAETRIRRGKIP